MSFFCAFCYCTTPSSLASEGKWKLKIGAVAKPAKWNYAVEQGMNGCRLCEK